MFSLTGIIAVEVLLGTVFLCSFVVVAGLRFVGIGVPFSLPFHIFKRSTPELLEALKGRSINAYVFISGLLLFAFPLFAGVTAYAYVVRRSVDHSAYKLSNFAGSVALFGVLCIIGVWISISQWQKAAESGIGLPLLAILILKVLMGTVGAMRTMLVVPAALCAAFVYLAIRRIRRPFRERRSSGRSEQRMAHNFISEQFVPTEQYKAQRKFIARSLITAGLSAEDLDKPSHDGDRSTPESL